MENNPPYAAIFLGIGTALFLIRFIYWKVTEVKADREKPRRDSAYSKKRLFTTSIALLVLLQLIGIDILPFPSSLLLQVVGLLLVVVGFAISMEGRRALGVNWTHAAEYQIKKNHDLVTQSIYQWIRHPIYAGYFLSLIGIELILSSYLCLIFGILGSLLLTMQASQEEKLLTEHFGQKYRDYKKITRRFLPFVW